MSDSPSAQERAPATRSRFEIAVLGSARLSESHRAWGEAYRLGGLLAEADFTVVTGGYGGLMAAVSQGAHEQGGYVVGLPMQHWTGLEPNRWNADVRWSSSYGVRLNHLLYCDAVIALPGGAGTLSEMAVAWAASQTEGRAFPIVLLGECWPTLVDAFRRYLVIESQDLALLHFAASPEEAMQSVQEALQQPGRIGPGPHG
jgi:uncharacterized protein (TIGR00730 family)